MHTVDRELNVSAQEVVAILLEVHEYLYPSDNWVSTRRNFLNESPATHLFFDTDHVEGLVAREFLTVFSFLTPSQASRFFKIDKKQRLYSCPECKYECDKYEMIEPRYAVLQPNEPDSENLYCFVCDSLHPVTRDDCKSGECPGNVISDEYGYCGTCGEDQGYPGQSRGRLCRCGFAVTPQAGVLAALYVIVVKEGCRHEGRRKRRRNRFAQRGRTG